MATNYIPTKETANFGKFARIILDLCRDAVFQILANEIPPADLPSKIRANLHLLKLSSEQLNKVLKKPPGVYLSSIDFDISALYTLLRNICPGISIPTQGWGYPPKQNDTRVSDDVERIRQKRNILFGHSNTAGLSDTVFKHELTDMKKIISRLDKHLGQNFLSGLCGIEGSSMEPEMQQMYSDRCLKLLKQDQETRGLLDAFKTQQEKEITLIKDQQIGAQLRQEETIDTVHVLQDQQEATRLRQEETIDTVHVLQDQQEATRLRQEETIDTVHVLQDQQEATRLRQEETIDTVLVLQDQQEATRLRQEETIDTVHVLQDQQEATRLRQEETIDTVHVLQDQQEATRLRQEETIDTVHVLQDQQEATRLRQEETIDTVLVLQDQQEATRLRQEETIDTVHVLQDQQEATRLRHEEITRDLQDGAQSELFIKRLSTCIVDGSIHVLKPFLQDYIETWGYQSMDDFLHRFKAAIHFIVLCSRVEMIFPPDQSSTDMAKWDVSLYFTILLNICNLSGQELRYLHELRLQRNNIYDKRDSSSLGQNVFNEYWSKIEKGLEALSKKDTQTTDGLQSMLDEIKSGMFVSDSAVEALIDWYNTEKLSENNTAALKQALQDHEKLVSVIEEFDTEQQFQRYRKRKRATVTISGYNAEDVRHAHEHMLPLKKRKSLRDPNLIAFHDAICKEGESEVVDIQNGSVTMVLECASAHSVIHLWNTYQSGIMATQFEGILRDLRLKTGREMALQITCNAEEFLDVLKSEDCKVQKTVAMVQELRDKQTAGQSQQEETIEMVQELRDKQTTGQFQQEETVAMVQELQDKQTAGQSQQEETVAMVQELRDKQISGQSQQEETIEMVQELRDKQTAGQSQQEETVAMVQELKAEHAVGQMRQEETMELVYDLQDKQEPRHPTLKESMEMLQGKVTDIKRKIEVLSQKDDHTSADLANFEDEAKVQNHLRQVYQGEKSPEVSIIPAYDDIPLSSVFTPIVIRDDLETTFRLQAKKPGGNMPALVGLNPETDKAIESYKQMFFKDGEFQKNVYLLGKAGSGKTTFCNHLIDLWCPSSTTAHYDNPEMITEFEFIFFVTCRDAEESHRVKDMILDQLFSAKIEYHSLVKHVLQTKPEKCLVVVDGLDEWVSSRTPSGLPDRRGLENCVFLATSRPWRIEALRKGVGQSCRIMEIQGLTEENVHSLADKAVKALNASKFHGEEVSSADFLSAVKKAKLTQIVTNPVMLLILLATWHDRRTLDISQCVNYACLIDSLLLQAEGMSLRTDASNRLSDLPELPGLKADWARSDTTLPECFSSLQFCKLYAQLISKVSKLAFNGLFHEIKEQSLVFSDRELRKYLQPSELDVCCRTGILSLSGARSKSLERMKTVSFLHTTVQEFLAAVWMTGDSYSDCLSVFKKHCKCVADVNDLSVFLVFLCGLSPEKGREVWRYIGELTGSDQAVHEYRVETGERDRYISSSYPVPRLQQLLLQCTAEAMHHRPDMPLNCLIQAYNIQDVYVDSGIPAENLDLLLGHAVGSDTGIKTLVMSGIKPSPEILEAINRMVSLECLAILSPPEHSNPTQLCEVIFTAVNSLSPVTSLKLTGMSIAAPNRLFTVQLPQMLKSLTLRQVSITGRMQVSWPVTMETLYMQDVTLDHDSVLQLATWLQGSSSLQELCIRELKCRDCGHCCLVQLDITMHTRLRKLELRGIDCGDLGVCVSPHMSGLRLIEMWKVSMSDQAWSRFALSLPPTSHQLTVKLANVNIDAATVSYIAAHHTVTRDVNLIEWQPGRGRRILHFHIGEQAELTHMDDAPVDSPPNPQKMFLK